MEKKKWTLVNAENVVALECGPEYSSKMLTGDEMAGFPVMNINEGTLIPFSRTGGGAHEETEIYYMVDCGDPSYVVLDDEYVKVKNGDIIIIPPHVFHWIDNTKCDKPFKNGDIIIIPPHVFHWIDNTKCDKPFKLFTFWPRQEQNEVFFIREKAWGTSVKNIDPEYTQKRLNQHE